MSFDLKQLGIEKSPIGTSKVTINDGEKVAHVVKRYFEINGVKIQGTESEDYGFYLKRVYKKNITKGIPKKIREKYFPPPTMSRLRRIHWERKISGRNRVGSTTSTARLQTSGCRQRRRTMAMK